MSSLVLFFSASFYLSQHDCLFQETMTSPMCLKQDRSVLSLLPPAMSQAYFALGPTCSPGGPGHL